MKKKLIAILLAGCMAGSLVGCTAREESKENEKRNEVTNNAEKEETLLLTDFAVKLFQESCQEGKNTLISPLSVLYALGMTANGAVDETLQEMEEMFGLTVEELNQYLSQYMKNLPQGEKYKLNLANALWFNEKTSFEVNQDFLQKNVDYYNSEIFEDTFDESFVPKINDWVMRKTEGMIPELVEHVSNDAVLYLLNALVFEAQWQTQYVQSDIDEKVFTMENGKQQNTKMMHSFETAYLEDEDTTGFLKYYKDNQYAFVGLLPKENRSIEEYVNSLSGEQMYQLLNSVQENNVEVYLPKFETEYSMELSGALKKMGMQAAFHDKEADFTGIGIVAKKENIYISDILHKTFFAVTENGTKAGAVSSAVFLAGGFLEEPKEVHLDRPFVYMIVDCENKIPIFIGTTMYV